MTTWIASPADYDAMTAKEQSEFRCAVDMGATIAGATLECIDRQMINPREWVDAYAIDCALWNWNRLLYRIAKPKPMEVWIGVTDMERLKEALAVSANPCRMEMVVASSPDLFIPGRAVCFVEKGG